ncbi:UDP-N-acetylglucosamine 2-epimerase (non-hydrolyzing) [bacterium D16-51]|nr:UDP-N-acetylglucosamine 2-epimerase (non-hydrolyzing) [bacterium D16-59]RKI60195.1 UDP-N-acetylglucosamine 2-epimerase (non-hydrolyzing) [bacterium D16-51]
MTIMHIVGNRPQFIKLAPVSKELHQRGYKDIIIHTGQHYDENMSDIFFRELGIDKPIENLEVGSGSHAEITAKAMVGVEKVCMKYKPALVILYGDTDSTLAAALACCKLNIPIAHVEAGTRSYKKSNPEETNRVIVDHISDICFCPDHPSVENLSKEGIKKNVFFTGDVMYDSFLQTKKKGIESNLLEKYDLEKEKYILMTWHRQENTDKKERVDKIVSFLEQINCKMLYPVHPRTKKALADYDLWERISGIRNLIIIDPVGYDEMVYLQSNCKLILTDSGGLSKESVFAGAKCLFMADLNVWPDLERAGWITHVDFDNESSIKNALNIVQEGKVERREVDYYGDGHAAEKIVGILAQKL